jgi:hypothetical protein
MSAASAVSAPSSARRGIVAPQPRVQLSVKQGDRLEIRPHEPIHLFLSTKIGASRSISGLNKDSPFRIVEADPPRGTVQPKIPGRWYRIEVKDGTRAGRVDRVQVDVRPTVPRALGWKELSFTLVSGSMRYY